jgi:N-acetylglucosaminyldiphosphoundecaprenol N-acetyl-beta-D-mannosaminyltransferase
MLAGEKKQAPRTMQRRGLDWLFRLVTDPRRSWRRYLSQNPWFKALMVLQVMGSS